MIIVFDPNKDVANCLKHGISLKAAEAMDFDRAVVVEDRRFDYRKTRYVAYGPIEGRLFCLYYTMRADVLRAIGLRKANERERKRYDRTKS